MKRTLLDYLASGWRIAYADHGSVVVESPTGHRERVATWSAKPR